MPPASGSALPPSAAQLPLAPPPAASLPPASSAATGRPPTTRALISALAIPGTPEHVRAARSFTNLVLGMHQFNDDGVGGLLVSELVSNSLQHSDSGRPGGTITVTVAITAAEALIEVTDDGGAGHPVPRPAAGDDDEDGRGLRLVQQFADSWGYFGGKDRLSTWFELKPPATQPKTPAPNGL